jgi:hypothetical protein
VGHENSQKGVHLGRRRRLKAEVYTHLKQRSRDFVS